MSTDEQQAAYAPQEWEQKWKQYWHENGMYAFHRNESQQLFSIDTPPPTVSGAIHIGHVYGYVQQDFIARFKRMQGYNVFYPFGFDDNGIGSEMFVEKQTGKHAADMTREEFRQICLKQTTEMEKKMQQLWIDLGISSDWNMLYRTISPEVMKYSQLSFIKLYEQGKEYRKKGPNFFCPHCSTAVSQAELEDMEQSGEFVDIQFQLTDGALITIATTRPELLPACVAIIIHPEDTENEHLVGKEAQVPLFNHTVPILTDERVGMEKGSGIVMCCTFGDQTDIDWYYAHNLPLRTAIDENGRMTEQAGKYEGMTVKEARHAVIADLDKAGHIEKRSPIEHTVKVHERCDQPIEFLITEQWFIKVLDEKDAWRQLGEQLQWYPPHMKTRYDNWVDGLQWDWCISRQRYFGIPFPVWYCQACGEVKLASEEQLPVDPLKDQPYAACECGSTEFTPEQDVLDTWATSALTPLINAGWDGETVGELYPITLRPQAHEIISFWLFHTIVKCYYHTGQLPFREVYINGHVLDPQGQKMSKSKGNIVDPLQIMQDHPADAIRFWTTGYRTGEDVPYKPMDVVNGERFLRKIWNAHQFADPFLDRETALERPKELEFIDQWLLAKIDAAVTQITHHFENYSFYKIKTEIRHVFWHLFCDNYLEIVKKRLYEEKDGYESAVYTLYHALTTLTQLIAPIMPFIAEEVYNRFLSHFMASESIHWTQWPQTLGITHKTVEKDGDLLIEAISLLRKYKSELDLPLNQPLAEVALRTHTDLSNEEAVCETVADVMHIDTVTITEQELEEQVTDISLNYAVAGPRHGKQVKEIEKALADGNYRLDGDVVQVELSEKSLTMDDEVKIQRSVTADGYTVLNGDQVAVLIPHAAEGR